jgi:hypothetical protein
MDHARVNFDDDDFATKEGREAAFQRVKAEFDKHMIEDGDKALAALQSLMNLLGDEEDESSDQTAVNNVGKSLSIVANTIISHGKVINRLARRERSSGNIYNLGSINCHLATAVALVRTAMQELAEYYTSMNTEPSEKPTEPPPS